MKPKRNITTVQALCLLFVTSLFALATGPKLLHLTQLQDNLNAAGNSITNAATVSATNVYCNNLTVTNSASSRVNLGVPYSQVIPESANFTATNTQTGALYNVTTGTNTLTAGLPTASSAGNGSTFFFRKTDAGAGTVLVNSTTLLGTQGHMAEAVSDGTNWYVKSFYGGIDSSGNITITPAPGASINLNPTSGCTVKVNSATVLTTTNVGAGLSTSTNNTVSVAYGTTTNTALQGNALSSSVLAAGTNATNTTNGLVTGTNSRLPANVTGIRLGAGAGSADTALTIGSGLSLSGGTLSNSSSLSLGTNATSAGLTYSGGVLDLSSAPNGSTTTNSLYESVAFSDTTNGIFSGGQVLYVPGTTTPILGYGEIFGYAPASILYYPGTYRVFIQVAPTNTGTFINYPTSAGGNMVDTTGNFHFPLNAGIVDSQGNFGGAGSVLIGLGAGGSPPFGSAWTAFSTEWSAQFTSDTNHFTDGTGAFQAVSIFEPAAVVTTSAATSGTVSYSTTSPYADQTIYLSSGSTISSITIARPGSGNTRAGEVLRLVSKSAVSSLSITGGTNQVGTSPSSLSAGGSAAFQALDTSGNYARLY